MRKKKGRIFNWTWIKENFWNVVAIFIMWQLIVYILLSIIVWAFGIELPAA